jgi:hypothetical protein
MSSTDKTLDSTLLDALIAMMTAPNTASTACLSTIAGSNNPRFWDQQWYDTNGQPFSLMFPVLMEPARKHSRIDPYFTLLTLK